MPRLTPLKSGSVKKIVAVDFDGTLVKNKYPYCENPNMELIEWIKTNRDKMILILHTCREGKQLEYAVDYLKDNFDISFDYVNENVGWKVREYGDCRKIYADIYIDDNARTTESLGEI